MRYFVEVEVLNWDLGYEKELNLLTKKNRSKTTSPREDYTPKTRLNPRNTTRRRAKPDNIQKNFSSIFHAISDPIVVFDTEFRVITINKSAELFFAGYPVGKKCFFTRHKFALTCKNCPTWQTLKTGAVTSGEVMSPKTGNLIHLKTYPIYNRLKKIKGVVVVGHECADIPARWKNQKGR